MKKTKILVAGARGALGTELVPELQALYGTGQVMAITGDFPQPAALERLLLQEQVTELYLLNEHLDQPLSGLAGALQCARRSGVQKVFWAGSAAVFGHGAPKHRCPQDGPTAPTSAWAMGEELCRYYVENYELDIRSLRLPGLLSPFSPPGAAMSDYASALFHAALNGHAYVCALNEDSCLPFIYSHDAARAVLELMAAPRDNIRPGNAYNLSALSFAPCDLLAAIRQHLPELSISYAPDSRAYTAASQPASLDDSLARQHWGWRPRFNLEAMTAEMLQHLCRQKGLPFPEKVYPDFPQDEYVFSRIYG